MSSTWFGKPNAGKIALLPETRVAIVGRVDDAPSGFAGDFVEVPLTAEEVYLNDYVTVECRHKGNTMLAVIELPDADPRRSAPACISCTSLRASRTISSRNVPAGRNPARAHDGVRRRATVLLTMPAPDDVSALLRRVGDLVARAAVTCGPATTAADIAHLMSRHGVGSVVVLADARPIGIITVTFDGRWSARGSTRGRHQRVLRLELPHPVGLPAHPPPPVGPPACAARSRRGSGQPDCISKPFTRRRAIAARGIPDRQARAGRPA
jgi:CBS domain protein